MQVIVEKAYGRFSKGHVFTDMPPNQAELLIRRGLVREVTSKGDGAAAYKSPVDRKMRASVKR